MEEDQREAVTMAAADAVPAVPAHDADSDAIVTSAVLETDEGAAADAVTPDAPVVQPDPDASPGAPPLAARGETPGDAGRALKVVLTLRPLPAAGGAGYQAVLAVGADGCDPQLHVAEVDGLPAALAEVPRLAARAEEHWQQQPRYPTWTRRSSPANPAGERPASSSRRTRTADTPETPPARHPQAPTPAGEAPTDVPATNAAPPKVPETTPARAVGSAPVKQLTLFG